MGHFGGFMSFAQARSGDKHFNLIKLKKGLTAFYTLAGLFFLAAFLGYILESCYYYIPGYGTEDRGLLTLPLIPIYGFGAVFVYLVLGTPLNPRFKKLTRPILGGAVFGEGKRPSREILYALANIVIYYFASMLLAQTLELVAGIFLDKVFGVRLWEHFDYKYNIGGYISLEWGFVWGLLITGAMALIMPLLRMNFAFYTPHGAIKIINVLIRLALFDAAFNFLYMWLTGEHLTLFHYMHGL